MITDSVFRSLRVVRLSACLQPSRPARVGMRARLTAAVLPLLLAGCAKTETKPAAPIVRKG